MGIFTRDAIVKHQIQERKEASMNQQSLGRNELVLYPVIYTCVRPHFKTYGTIVLMIFFLQKSGFK